MAGRSSTIAARLLACALPAVAIAGGAAGEVVKGQSRDLGIQFEVSGGSAWCKPSVAVALTAARPDAFQPDDVPFVKMLGRIRAIVMDQCPAVERIAFDASARSRPVLSIEMTRLTRWRRLFRIDPDTRRPACRVEPRVVPLVVPRVVPGRSPAEECGRRSDAYLVTHRTMRGDQFAEAELTTVLDEQDDAHAVWVLGDVIGKLTIMERSEFSGRYASNADLGRAIAGAIGAQCGRDGGISEEDWGEAWFLRSDREIAVRGISCRPKAGAPSHHAVLVTTEASRFHIFALLTSASDAKTARDAAAHMASAIGAAQ
jgi:hypothetical protein